MSVRVALTLPPRHADLDLLAPLLARVDLFEITPETTWFSDTRGSLRPNSFHRRFAELLRTHRKSAIAHGVGLSPGSARPDPQRRRRWLERIAADHAAFRFEWYSDHYGATELCGEELLLPQPLPDDSVDPMAADGAVAATRSTLAALQELLPDVALENSAFLAEAPDPAAQARLLARCIAAPRCWIVLDLHNLHVMARNGGVAAERFLSELPFDRVIELHLSGGRASDPAWLRSGRSLRLDSHDTAVPEAVFALAEAVAPRCPALRAVTLERMESTFGAADVAGMQVEIDRLQAIAATAAAAAPPTGTAPTSLREKANRPAIDRLATLQQRLAGLVRAADPRAAYATLAAPEFAAFGADGFELTSLLVARLRFERVMHGSAQARADFERDPAAFAAAFRRFHVACAPVGGMPQDEGQAFDCWRRGTPAER